MTMMLDEVREMLERPKPIASLEFDVVRFMDGVLESAIVELLDREERLANAWAARRIGDRTAQWNSERSRR